MPSSAAVVEILKSADTFVSGEEIAGTLGVSRASVWKRIKGLRDMGFDITASTNLGYRLVSVPDIPSGEVLSTMLNTSVIGKTIEYYPEIASTNDRAMMLGDSSAVSGTVITADRQTAGKARNGGTWSSPSGKNLYLSILLRPEVELARAGEVAELALKSLELSALGYFPQQVFVAKSYGLFVNEKKLGGILCEVRGEIGNIYYMAVGAGLNVSHYESDSCAESLFSLTGKMLSRAELTVSFLENFEKLYLNWKDNE
ncbi:MAG: biotin--[acetyl-CoA-carboxylase] ligase [Candidatus Sabulitectum sp.]|nr:biotin--[acetyl-CoA-carboxylase] ligase [Candidatus Sabulitectum sp.]